MSTPSEGRTRHELWVGLFVILGFLGGLGTLFALTDPALFRGRYVVSTVVPDAAGVRRGDPVQLRGVNIGRVQRFKIVNDQVTISLEIEGEFLFPADSSAGLKSTGLLGGTIVEISPGSSATVAKGGDALVGKSSAGIMDTASDLAKRAQLVLDQAGKLLSEQNVANIHASTEKLTQTLAQVSDLVREQRTALTTLEASLQKSADQVAKLTGDPGFQGLPDQAAATMARLKSVSESLERSAVAVEKLAARVDRGEGTLGKLSADSKLYDSLNEATASLNKSTTELAELIADVKKHPKKYLKFSVF